jgi:hypothetical protein
MKKLSLCLVLLLLVLGSGVSAQDEGRPPWVLAIYSPMPYQNIGAGLEISGIGWGLFENSLIVEVTNSAGEIISQQPITMSAPDLGRYGTWVTFVELSGQEGEILTISAYSTSPRDGSIVVKDTVKVVYGVNPPGAMVHILSPQPYTEIPNTTIVAGVANYPGGGYVVVQVLDEAGTILSTNSTAIGGIYGINPIAWVVEVQIPDDQYYVRFVATASPGPDLANGVLLANDEVEVRLEAK